ncbi:MAG: hypothetical protein KBC91_03845, partial [Candidatus Omnitrophica bacterium]|nr:hypothetical protein [Candidatus Omnitrophota bacterium]
QRRLALRVLLDTLSDFDLKDLAKGNHPIQKMLESAGIPEAVIFSTAEELLRRHEMLWAMDQAAQWEREVTLKSQVFIPGEAALNNLAQALAHENFSPERVESALSAARRDQPRLSLRLEQILEALDRQIEKGADREVIGHVQTWRLSLAFILAAMGFALGGAWGVFNLVSSKAYWPGKRNSRSEVRAAAASILSVFAAKTDRKGSPRSEVREAPAAFLRALTSKEQLLQQARIAGEFGFSAYQARAQKDFGVGLEAVLPQIPAAVNGLRSTEGQAAFSGEIILSYRADSHAADFAEQLTSLMKRNPGIQQLTLIPSARASETEWNQFKMAVRAEASSSRIVFGDEQGFEALQDLTQERMRTRGLSPQALVQILEPARIREQDKRMYDQFLVQASLLGRETLLILGYEEPLKGSGLILTVEQVLETAFQAYALVSSAA